MPLPILRPPLLPLPSLDALHDAFLTATLLLHIGIDLRPLLAQPVPHQLQNPHNREDHLPEHRPVLRLTRAIRSCHVLHDGPRVLRHLLHRLLVLLLDLRQNGRLPRFRRGDVLLFLSASQRTHALHIGQLLHFVVLHEQLLLLLHCLPLTSQRFEPTCNSPICCFIISAYSQYI